MENDIFTALLPTTDHNHTVFNAVSSHIFSGPFIQPGIIDHNIHGQIMAGNPLFSTVQEDHSLNNFYITNHGGMPTGEAPISRTMLHVGNTFVDGSSENNHLGTSLSATSLVNLLSPTTGLRENLLSNDISSTSALPSDMRAFISHPTPRNCGYGPQDGAGYDEPMGFQLPSINTVCPSYHVVGSSLPGWNANNSTLKSDHSKSYHVPRNELSLSLSSCQPSTVCMPNIPDQCSEKSCSVVTQVAPKDTEELSLFCGASSTVHFSRVLLGSRYFHAAQQILAEVANYALENSEEFDDSLSGIEGEARISFSSSCSSARGFSAVASDEFLPSGEPKSQESEAEKTKLLTMLQMIDHKYNQCLDQIQNVITAFHDSTNSGIPHMHARFTFHTISAIYKNLRERITSQVFLTGQQQKGECIREKEKAFESSFIQKQWALQHLGRKDQQSWRPQRGLPERSVSVLRAWMFQNFLHPYPKDNDKHLLAIKSGLTRSQVSNWFINARVRLWKPMIEEMHSEIMRKHQTEGVEGDCRSHRNIGNQRIRMS